MRDHLTAVARVTAAVAETAPPETATVAEIAASSPAADLAAIYELARYSAHTIDAAQARRFEALARAFDV